MSLVILIKHQLLAWFFSYFHGFLYTLTGEYD